MRSLVQRTALALAAVVGLLGTRPATANAQKALVYCPVNVDATGCNAIVNALTGPAYPLGVDRGYDGTGGTVDLKTVDLFAYSVFVVPSLADDATSQPYATLRDPEVVDHLKAALIGRLAMWSGSPDQGASNRAMKDALIQNLAGWAGGAFATAKGPGLVALLDASASATSRYDWVRAITPVPVTSDPALLIYNSVRALNARATTILTSGAGPIVYDNMATFGFQVPNGAAGVSLDAVGQTGTSQGGQVVLLTMEAGNSTGATVKTDAGDYAPGTTVVITGSGWAPNETVKLTLHMDPLRDSDTELSATADANGNITNIDFAPKEYDVGVRFVLTAVGQTSGRRAQTTFTDSRTVTSVTLNGGSSVTVTAGANISAVVNVTTASGNGNQNWHSTGWLIATTPPGTVTCVNHADHDGSGSYTESFTITAPGSTGTFNAYFIAYSNDSCSQQASSTFSLANGVTVAKATPTITWANPANITYPTALSGTQLNATASVPGSFAYTPAAATVLSAGNGQTLHVDFTPTDAANYNTASKDVTINVLQAAQTITFGALPNKTFGDAPFTVSATASSGLAVTFTASGNCTAAEDEVTQVTLTGAGNCTITAHQAGNANYQAAADVPQAFTIGQAAQTITFGALANKTFGDAPFTVSATASSGLTVTFTASGNCTVAGDEVTLTGAGSCTITAHQAGNANYQAAADVPQAFTIDPAAQTITFGALANKTSGDAPFTVSATASSGLAVTFTASGNCTVAGDEVTLTGAGNCTITAHQAGNGNYQAAADVPQAFTIGQAAQTITFGALANKTFGDAPFTVSATASSGLAVMFTASGNCTVAGDEVTLTGAGSCTITAHQAGNANYQAAADVPQAFTIALATPTITWANPADITYPTALSATQLNATASVPGAFAYTPAAGTVLNAGNGQTLTVDFTPTDVANYTTASTNVLINVLQATQSIMFTSTAPSNAVVGGPTYTVTATGGGSGNAVTFTSGTPGTCSVATNVVTMLASGTCTIKANQAGNANYLAAPEATQSFGVVQQTNLYLHGIGANANPATLTLDATAPTAATAKYKDSPSIDFNGGNPWALVGQWSAASSLFTGTLSALDPVQLWLGLKNSDDQGTSFDIRVEVSKNGTVIATGERTCIKDVTRNENLAKLVNVVFAPFPSTTFNGTSDVLAIKVLTRIGTTGGVKCVPGHNNAVGLRTYFDAATRNAGLTATY